MNERRGTKGLELWCRKMTEGYPGVKIDNMTTSWRDGLAFCAIIHHFRPDLIDFSKLNKDDVYQNNELAFRIAEQYLGIPALLEPEDMVEYSVPDRLSILTYLSQFYQAFAVREGASPARIAPKRPQSSADHGIVSPASTSPPTKVALTGASLRREPCTKCGLPVFIAERLNIGKSLFHRTCFRCARCNSQLTPANYYETENNEFCCEICPDEEKVMSKTSVQNAVLQRSMSDEEKTASLKIVSNEPDEFSAMFESALEESDAEKVQTLSREFDSARSDFFQSQMVETSDSSNEDSSSKEETKPPDLPISLPPMKKSESAQDSYQFDSGFPSKDVSVKTSFSDNVESQNVVTKESVVKTRMRLFENNLKADVHSEKVPLPNASIPSSIKNVDNSVSENKEDTKHSARQEFSANSGKDIPSNRKSFTTSISLNLSKEKNNLIETQDANVISHSLDDNNKEKQDLSVSTISDYSSLDQTRSTTEEPIEISDEVISINDSIEHSTSKIDEAIQAINSTIISLQDSSEYLSPASTPHTEESPKLNSRLSSGDYLQQSEDSKSDPNDFSFIDEEGYNDKSTEIKESINYNVKDSTQFESEQNVNGSPVETINYRVKESELAPDDEAPNTKGKVDQVNEVVETVNHEINKSELSPVDAINENIKLKSYQDHKVVETINIRVEEPKSISFEPILETQESYPEDLNPFDDDQPTASSSNPFGSDDEDQEPLAVSLKKPVPSPRFKKKMIDASACRKIMESPMKEVNIQRISINPFESDDDDDYGDKPPVPALRKKKISVPKNSSNPFSSDDDDEHEGAEKPLPTPRRASSRLSELRHQDPNSLSISGHNFGGSNSSISSGSYYGSARKKRPAPKPPIPTFKDGSNNSSLTSTPSQSVQHSPKTTPKYKKEKRAPPPPPKFTSTPNKSPENIQRDQDAPKEITQSQDDLHKEKVVKDEANRNRQSQNFKTNEDNPNQLIVPNKSTYGKWKRKKGQAPAKPVPPQKRTIKCLPMAEIKKELEFIEIQQQGLEKQGVRIEQIIREKCEGETPNGATNPEDDIPIEVEDLILQLFELVNEKNELFRKQTELMYLRRQQRLEEEHADVEYQIRCLMMQPEANKTDFDKAREEELIRRLVDIVERRNEIVECLEKDRVREAEEDDSINTHINLFTLSRDSPADKSEPKSEKPKKEKQKGKDKEKKKEKKSKHKSKNKVDVDKDVDETETSVSTLEKKKKKKFNLF